MSSHPPFNHNPHVYGGVDPAKRAAVEPVAVTEAASTDSPAAHSDVAAPADEEATEPTTAEVAGASGVSDTASTDTPPDEDANVDVDGDGKVDGYEMFTKAELIAHIDTLNEGLPEDERLSTAGNKPDLVRRIQEHEAATNPSSA
jgi:hypothetical protein